MSAAVHLRPLGDFQAGFDRALLAVADSVRSARTLNGSWNSLEVVKTRFAGSRTNPRGTRSHPFRSRASRRGVPHGRERRLDRGTRGEQPRPPGSRRASARGRADRNVVARCRDSKRSASSRIRTIASENDTFYRTKIPNATECAPSRVPPVEEWVQPAAKRVPSLYSWVVSHRVEHLIVPKHELRGFNYARR